MDFPMPRIGYYQAECCLMDLYKIESQQDLDDALDRIERNDECGQLMIFKTLSEAISILSNNGLSREDEERELARLIRDA